MRRGESSHQQCLTYRFWLSWQPWRIIWFTSDIWQNKPKFADICERLNTMKLHLMRTFSFWGTVDRDHSREKAPLRTTVQHTHCEELRQSGNTGKHLTGSNDLVSPQKRCSCHLPAFQRETTVSWLLSLSCDLEHVNLMSPGLWILHLFTKNNKHISKG